MARLLLMALASLVAAHMALGASPRVAFWLAVGQLTLATDDEVGLLAEEASV
jgi:hypothetical protein